MPIDSALTIAIHGMRGPLKDAERTQQTILTHPLDCLTRRISNG